MIVPSSASKASDSAISVSFMWQPTVTSRLLTNSIPSSAGRFVRPDRPSGRSACQSAISTASATLTPSERSSIVESDSVGGGSLGAVPSTWLDPQAATAAAARIVPKVVRIHRG